MKKLILIPLTLILAACSMTAYLDFNKSLSKWQSMNITHYRYTLFLGCFCAFRDQMPLTIEVKDRQTVSITRADGTVIKENDPSCEVFKTYSTMDNIFTDLKNKFSEADEVTTSYDAAYGYPTNIYIDQIKDAVDDELSIQITNFETLK